MEADAKLKLRELRVDGGATVNPALMQFQSDLLRVPVIRPRTTETTALGAAYLAGLAVGVWKNREEIATLWGAGRTFRPYAPRPAMRELQRNWHRAVERAKAWSPVKPTSPRILRPAGSSLQLGGSATSPFQGGLSRIPRLLFLQVRPAARAYPPAVSRVKN